MFGVENLICFFRYVVHAKKWDNSSRIEKPLYLSDIKNISIGSNSRIRKNSFIFVKTATGCSQSELIIGNNTRLSYGVHIVATQKIEIGNNVNFAPNVYLADNSHNFEDVNVAPKDQPLKQLNPVIIGDDTWIGRNVCVIGCSVGKHCVIGANSVVKHDIPDYSVVAGAPARIIKRYNFESLRWEKTNSKGDFIS